jgi:hypothetical protein
MLLNKRERRGSNEVSVNLTNSGFETPSFFRITLEMTG